MDNTRIKKILKLALASQQDTNVEINNDCIEDIPIIFDNSYDIDNILINTTDCNLQIHSITENTHEPLFENIADGGNLNISPIQEDGGDLSDERDCDYEQEESEGSESEMENGEQGQVRMGLQKSCQKNMETSTRVEKEGL